MAPFVINVNGEVLKSEGAVLVVQSSTRAAPSLTGGVPSTGAAFLALRPSRRIVYTGEGVGLTLSFFVADDYPYVLSFSAIDRQLQSIIKKIRPANTWEENRPINELKPKPVLIGGRKFREIELYQSVFYPLTARRLTLPAITLHVSRPRPNIGPPTSEVETVAFSSKPVTISVRSLPAHPLRGQVAVGSFRLNERIDQQRVKVGQSVRYVFSIEGEGNVAMLPAPATLPKTQRSFLLASIQLTHWLWLESKPEYLWAVGCCRVPQCPYRVTGWRAKPESHHPIQSRFRLVQPFLL